MPGKSSSAVEWFTQLEPAERPAPGLLRPDDPRLGQVIESWNGDPEAFRPGRAILVGFPQEEGVRRNGGHPGAALAPKEIRSWLHRLTPWDAPSDADLAAEPPLDIGNVRI